MIDLSGLQKTVTNRLPSVAAEHFAAIIGDRPSQSAKSPSIWNPAFQTLGLPAAYLPLDVEPTRLGDVIRALRRSPDYLGGNVTMPYKVAVMEHLDDVDEMARGIGAVNTITRDSDGRLVGSNTDGKGGLDCLTRVQPGQSRALCPDITGRRMLLLGAGGAARALAFYLADALGPRGHLAVWSRAAASADALASAVAARFRNCAGIAKYALDGFDVVINATTVGQSGVRRLANGRATCLEPYSPLAPASPPELDPIDGDEAAFYRAWSARALRDVSANHAASFERLAAAPGSVAFFDIIFAPVETVLLRQARLTGHATLNGKGMNIAQAADGFVNRVCRDLLARRGLSQPQTYQQVLETMYRVW